MVRWRRSKDWLFYYFTGCHVSHYLKAFTRRNSFHKKECIVNKVNRENYWLIKSLSRRSNDWIFASLKKIKQLKWLNWTKLLLKELRNLILRTIFVWSLFCLIRVYVGLHFLWFLWENQFFCVCFCAFFESRD